MSLIKEFSPGQTRLPAWTVNACFWQLTTQVLWCLLLQRWKISNSKWKNKASCSKEQKVKRHQLADMVVASSEPMTYNMKNPDWIQPSKCFSRGNRRDPTKISRSPPHFVAKIESSREEEEFHYHTRGLPSLTKETSQRLVLWPAEKQERRWWGWHSYLSRKDKRCDSNWTHKSAKKWSAPLVTN